MIFAFRTVLHGHDIGYTDTIVIVDGGQMAPLEVAISKAGAS